MAAGLLPSLREYAARYGLTAERLALAPPGALVMHPGPMNEGVEIARRRRRRRRSRSSPTRSRTASRSGWPCCTCWPAVPRGVSGRRRAPAPRPRDQPRLAGRPGAPAARVRARSSSATASSRPSPGSTATTPTASTTPGVVVAPGFIDLHAHLREPGNEDAETVATGLAAAAHGGFTTVVRDAQHDAAARRAGRPGAACAPRPSPPARRSSCWPTAP